MNTHEQVSESLALYAAGGLAEPERDAIARHVSNCSECQAELALWQTVRREIESANAALVVPLGPLHRALAETARTGILQRSWTLVQAQAPLVRRELFPASAVLMALGVLVSILIQRAGLFHFLAPMIAAASLAVIYRRGSDPASELTLATPTSAWKILLARLTLLSAYNLGLTFLASIALWAFLPVGLFGSVILQWLGPLTFLSALALVLSMWAGAGTALALSYLLWTVQWLPLRAVSNPAGSAALAGYQSFWQSPVALLLLSLLLIVAALWGAERAMRPGIALEAGQV